MSRLAAPLLAVAFGAMLLACGGPAGRAIKFVADDQTCTPAAVTAAPGERLVLEVSNQSKRDREVEGIEGTKLEEVVIPSGRVRKLSFTMPDSGKARLKCYIPGGPATIIEITPAK